jgi:hypothetical protein
MAFRYDTLKARHREIRGGMDQHLSLRLHRALSWLQRAEQERDDDSCFIFLWIAFNAVYARELGSSQGFSERTTQKEFFRLVTGFDRERLIYKAIWTDFPDAIRVLMNNPFVFPDFWEYHTGTLSETDWQEAFSRKRRHMLGAIERGDAASALGILFERLYTLRNQLVHGGATWGGKVNRSQVKDGRRILETLVPVILHVMLEAPPHDWGPPAFPVVDAGTTGY